MVSLAEDVIYSFPLCVFVFDFFFPFFFMSGNPDVFQQSVFCSGRPHCHTSTVALAQGRWRGEDDTLAYRVGQLIVIP